MPARGAVCKRCAVVPVCERCGSVVWLFLVLFLYCLCKIGPRAQ
jgi:hypothetical protein